MFLPIIVLTSTALLAFFWHNNPLMAANSLQLIAGLVVVFLLFNHKNQHQNVTNSSIITLIVLLLVLGTGGLSSPLFFILDFLLFALSLLVFPSLGLILALALTMLFLLNTSQLDSLQITNLISLLLMAPVAQLIGTQYLRLINAQKEISDLSDQSERLQTTISNEEEVTLLWLSLNFHNKIHQAMDLLSQFNTNLTHLPYHQKDKLNTLYQDLKELFKSGEELKDKINKINEN